MTDERPMPANDEAERALLGCMLIGERVFDRIQPIVNESDFRLLQHRRIFATISEFEGKGVDLLTVKSKLSALGKMDEAGGSVYVSSLTDAIPDVANAEKYARLVRETSQRRDAIVQCNRLTAAAYSGEPISDIAATGALMFSDIAASRDDGPVAIRDVARRTFESLEARIAREAWMTGIPSGVQHLDSYTLGFQRGVESVIGARPRVGKTAFAICIAAAALQAENRVMFVQLDMSESMFGCRLLATTAGVSSYKIRSGRGITPEESTRIAQADSQLRRMGDRLVLDYRTRAIAKIAAHVRRNARSFGLDLLIVDHIGHVRGGKGEKRYLELGDVSARLIEIAGETNAAVVTLMQLGREAESRPPMLADLRESGNLEADARLVVLLDRPHLRGEDAAECRLNLLVPKNEGETGADVVAHFDLQTQRITSERVAHCRYCVGLDRQREIA